MCFNFYCVTADAYLFTVISRIIEFIYSVFILIITFMYIFKIFDTFIMSRNPRLEKLNNY